MMQVLLTERFKLVLHREKREVQGYALAVQKDGTKMHAVEDPGPNSPMRSGRLSGGNRLLSGKMPMVQLAQQLRGILGRPVMDASGLSGFFDVTLQWSSDDPPTTATTQADIPFPPLPAALKSQLGLQLEARKIEVEYLVVVGGEKTPIEN